MELTWELVVGICGGVVLLYNAGEKIYRIFKPAADWKKKVDRLQSEVEELRSYTDRDYDGLQHMLEMQKGIITGQITMMNHMIDGNGVEEMKKTREDLMNLRNKI